MLPFRAKRIRCLFSSAHNGLGAFGTKRLFLTSTGFVKVFRRTFKAMRFQGLYWLQQWGSAKALFGAKVV